MFHVKNIFLGYVNPKNPSTSGPAGQTLNSHTMEIGTCPLGPQSTSSGTLHSFSLTHCDNCVNILLGFGEKLQKEDEK